MVLKSVPITMFATLRTVNTDPASSPMISLAGTRASEQPVFLFPKVHRNYLGNPFPQDRRQPAQRMFRALTTQLATRTHQSTDKMVYVHHPSIP